MRIGLIAPPWLPVPPPAYGGTELVVDCLARGLRDLGHEVRLFTVGESTCPVVRDCLYPEAWQPMGESTAEAAHVLAAYEALAGVDIIHDHTILGPLLAAGRELRHPPVVTTCHGVFTAQTRSVFAEAARHAAVMSISRAQAATAGDVPIAAVIHHGIDLRLHRPGPGDGGYLLFVGRMAPEKGVHHAVRVAQAAGQRLVIAAKMRTPAERRYFEREIRPLLRPGDGMPSEQPLRPRLALMRHAVALLAPITWAEPFGLVMVEALAAGTPVLAFPNGAAPEIVEHGKTGYLCRDEKEMISALGNVPQISRGDCRAAAEQRFSLHQMALQHERLYRRILLSGIPAARPQPAARDGKPGARQQISA